MRTRTRRAAATAVLLPLLAAAVGCQAAGTRGKPAAEAPSPTGKPVYEEKLADQLNAAARATAATGSARFTATLSYGSAEGTAVETTTGVLDYARDSARVTRSYVVPRGFPEDTATELGLPSGARDPQVFAVEENDVGYRTARGTWLRYDASGSKEFTDRVGEILALAGESEPWGGTLADVVRHADPERAPRTGADGRRTYRVDVYGRSLTDLLPAGIRYASRDARTPGEVPVTVVLDKDGRLLSAEADYAPLLRGLRGAGVLRGVTSLRATYTLTGHGGQTVPGIPAGERTEDAERVTAALVEVKPGACASTDTGLGSADRLVRPVACGKDADVRVFAVQRVDETYRNKDPQGLGRALAAARCREDLRTVPAAWTRDAHPAGTYQVGGTETVSYGYTGPEATVSGDFVCYVTLR
ncbi:hypothetical protein [Streptomyces sp. NRRL F-5727]|uniref:hypothetical protein n=1 Tax=Streptomyces sp. NRRL F-5727 TaxID=1463871 RepID=UPI0004C816DA|nr:hypothetical protein [Streptomyces sp. NRRL F-5727]